MVRWSRLSGGQVVRAVKVFMMARVVQVVQTAPVVAMVQVIWLVRMVQVVMWSGGKSGQGGQGGRCFQKIHGFHAPNHQKRKVEMSHL